MTPAVLQPGAYYEKKGEIDQAIYFYEASVKFAPEIAKIHGALSVLYERKGWKERVKKLIVSF